MNAQAELEKLISRNAKEGKRPKLLLHCCCAPCASYCLEYLTPHFEVTAFYDNPNITDEAEYDKRLAELKRLAEAFGVSVVDGGYDGKRFFEAVKGLESEPERGARCAVCFGMRLKDALIRADDYDYFATTLTLSPLKNADLINDIGSRLSDKYLPTDFKKKDGYKRSIELSKRYDLYRQNYCGCVFSKRKDDNKKDCPE